MAPKLRRYRNSTVYRLGSDIVYQPNSVVEPHIIKPNFLHRLSLEPKKRREIPNPNYQNPPNRSNWNTQTLARSVSMSYREESGAEEASKDMAAKYEEQRRRRIKENNERMEAMGLRKMSSFLTVCEEKKDKRKLKGKAKLEEEEYRPSDDDDDEEEEEFVGDRPGKPPKKKTPKKMKKVLVQNLMDATEVMDEDKDLKLAIALSLREAENVETVHSVVKVDTEIKEATARGMKEGGRTLKDNGNRKRKKQMGSRVQMMEEEVILHFFQFDETGKGGINLRDLRRMAYAHDFTWADEEMVDMIKCFDSDGDGKLSLDDFRCIVERCNLIRRPDCETTT